jgi:predicted Zn-dependent protease
MGRLRVAKKYPLLFIFCCFCCWSIASLVWTEGELEDKLPPLQVHPLPISLENWQDPSNSGNYFDRITPSSIGHLIWSEFPIEIYLDKPVNVSTANAPTAEEIRFQKWLEAARTGIAEWNEYLPSIEVMEAENADITIVRKQPDIKPTFDRTTGKFTIPRARTAQTSYEFYFKPQNILAQRMTLQISPNLNDSAVMSAMRHELGHAFGIWGHSPTETDVMFFSQVRDKPYISARDINTLKKIYQQPTRLGWKAAIETSREYPYSHSSSKSIAASKTGQ